MKNDGSSHGLDPSSSTMKEHVTENWSEAPAALKQKGKRTFVVRCDVEHSDHCSVGAQ